MLVDYAEKKKITRDYELFDLEDMLHCPTLLHLVEDRNANIVMYSIFALPENEAERNHLLETSLKRGNIIHFVNEDLQLVNADDLATIKHYLAFAKLGHSRLPIGLPLSDTTRDYFGKWNETVQQYSKGPAKHDLQYAEAPAHRRRSRFWLAACGRSTNRRN